MLSLLCIEFKLYANVTKYIKHVNKQVNQ